MAGDEALFVFGLISGVISISEANTIYVKKEQRCLCLPAYAVKPVESHVVRVFSLSTICHAYHPCSPCSPCFSVSPPLPTSPIA